MNVCVKLIQVGGAIHVPDQQSCLAKTLKKRELPAFHLSKDILIKLGQMVVSLHQQSAISLAVATTLR